MKSTNPTPPISAQSQNVPIPFDGGVTEGETPEYSDLWLPFEAQIQRLCSSGNTSSAVSRQTKTRRALVEKLFASWRAGDSQATEAVEAFLTILRRYISATQELLEEGGYSQKEAENRALQNLACDTDFLQKATAYANAYQSWLIDLIEAEGDEPGENVVGEGGAEKPLVVACADDYLVHTSQESAVLLMSMCDGKSGRNWDTDEQAGTRTYYRQGLPHRIQLKLEETERGGDPSLGMAALESMMHATDADGTFAVLYVSRLLAPPDPLPRNALASDWIELDDVISKIGWDPRSTKQRQEMRRRVWDYLRFCARANIMGNRTGVYRDPTSGEEISTRIEGPIWSFMKEERPIQPSLWAEEEVPLRVQIAVSREWTKLTTTSSLAQFLPSGELLGSIAPDKPSGAWARVIGLALLSLWRRKPRETLDGTIQPTRRELLSAYPPKVAPLEDILNGPHPRRALDYWQGALAILVDKGILDKSGEAAILQSQIVLPRKGWTQSWCDERVFFVPGPALRASVERCANNLPAIAPRNLSTSPRKRGRPRKTIETG